MCAGLSSVHFSKTTCVMFEQGIINSFDVCNCEIIVVADSSDSEIAIHIAVHSKRTMIKMMVQTAFVILHTCEVCYLLTSGFHNVFLFTASTRVSLCISDVSPVHKLERLGK